jgi:hypothetical protein
MKLADTNSRSMMSKLVLWGVPLSGLLWLAGSDIPKDSRLVHVHLEEVAPAEEPIRFNRDMRGLLADRCFACHGPDASTLQADLRLDLRSSAVDESQVILPGNAAESELFRRVLSNDPGEIMPPPELNKPLSDQEKQLLQRWIDEGAEYEEHWAYVPPRWPAEISPRETDSLSHLIDTLIENQLSKVGLQPAAEADRITLIRRLSIDLTGIPPTAREVEDFIHDSAPDAYSRLVDRLLASPRYGERMAIFWLDLVRYADTVGYHGDQNISQSPFRDYVIRAFNDNLPYDQFVREQLAGDLLPDPTLNQLVASGYNRLNQTTEEGGSQAKEYLAIYLGDRVRNASQVFLGSTLGCAQCHDHKYDPFTIEDFYAFGAFFADLEEVGVYSDRGRPPMIPVPDPQAQAQIEHLDLEIARLEGELTSQRAAARQSLAALERSALEVLRSGEIGEINWVADQESAIVTEAHKDAAWKYVTADSHPVHSGFRARKQQHTGLVQHLFLGVDTQTVVTPETRFFAWVYLDPQQPPAAIMLQFHDRNWEHRKVWGTDDIVYGRTPENRPAYQRAGNLPETGRWVRLEVDAAEVGLPAGAKINGMAFTQFGGLVYWDDAGIFSPEPFPASITQGLRTPAEDRGPEVTAALEKFLIDQADPVQAILCEVNRLRGQRQSLLQSAPNTVISRSVTPRTIRVLPRGNWMDDSGEIVQPAIPRFLGTLELEREATRLDLANWIVEPDNPLTARTMVNRLWSLLFGRGLCSSLDDFGGQGTYPSYPELLDALAIDFVESGWDIKRLLRQMVLSETYRRTSLSSDELRQRDPYNQWFARQERFPLLAESVRDAALAISGLLVEQVGGRSVHPYQPAGYYSELNFPKREYQPDLDLNQFRRGVYTHWQRTFLHPMLKAFDAPSREECTAQRSRSNTPLQALTLLNDPSFVEAARGLAIRMIEEGGDSLDARLAWAYREAVSRHPQPEIVAELRTVYHAAERAFRDDPAAAGAFLKVGIKNLPPSVDQGELAPFTSVARVILNLHEVITRY